MLPNEITPFADANRLELDKIRTLLIKIRASDILDADTAAEVDTAMDMTKRISRSFDRFEACLRDEQTTKNRYEKKHREDRLKKLHEQQ